MHESQQNQQNADWFDISAHRYHEKELVDHDAFISLPLYNESLQRIRKFTSIPHVLDLGAGVGISTLPFLEAGARVTAVDISRDTLGRLSFRAGNQGERLITVATPALDFVQQAVNSNERFDIVVCRAFLHHIPNYSALIDAIIPVIAPHGVFITFAEPTRFDSIPRWQRAFSFLSYAMVRAFKGNYLRGFKTRIRRLHGVYRPDLPEDNVEYHMVRNGVDQVAIKNLFEQAGFESRILFYFGTANRLMRPLGNLLRVHTSFAIFATRP